MKKCFERLYNGILKENPVLVLMLGMCPAFAVTKAAINGITMGLSTMAVLVLSNLIISCLRKVIPDQVRLPCYIVIVASFVTVVKLLIEAYLPDVNEALGSYIELIVVNCIILGRAEAYANKHTPLLSVMDGVGMGLGFTLALTLAGALRELLGTGKIFGAQLLPEGVKVGIFVEAPGAFLIFALIIAVMNAIGIKTRQRKLVEGGCDGNCALCASAASCETKPEAVAEKTEAAVEKTEAAAEKAEQATAPAEATEAEGGGAK